jgi:hypothetical protein
MTTSNSRPRVTLPGPGDINRVFRAFALGSHPVGSGKLALCGGDVGSVRVSRCHTARTRQRATKAVLRVGRRV